MPDRPEFKTSVKATCVLCKVIIHSTVFTSQDLTPLRYTEGASEFIRAMEAHYRDQHTVTDLFDIE